MASWSVSARGAIAQGDVERAPTAGCGPGPHVKRRVRSGDRCRPRAAPVAYRVILLSLDGGLVPITTPFPSTDLTVSGCCAHGVA